MWSNKYKIIGFWKTNYLNKDWIRNIYNGTDDKVYYGEQINSSINKEEEKSLYSNNPDRSSSVSDKVILKKVFNPTSNCRKGEPKDFLTGKIYSCALIFFAPVTLHVTKYLKSEFIRHIEIRKHFNNYQK